MQRREWHELGQALRDLRTSRDLGQKEVISRSGEAMAERTLRAYESGEQRPSRDRLLRLMIRSFDLTNAIEINRYFQLGDYALLSASEIRENGIEPSIIPGLDSRVGRAAGPPADFRTESSTLIVTDGQGQEVWRHQFPVRFARTA